MNNVANTQQAAAWNGYEGQHWADNHEHWDAVAGALNVPIFTAASIGAEDRVLDVACGNGQTTRLAAGMASRWHVLGVDLSGPMVRQARALAAEEGIGNVLFEQGDAQVHPFPPGQFDVAISRGGVSFFADPIAAFANIASALRPGGRLAFVCLQDMRRQEWFTVFLTALLGRAPEPDPADPYAPGMFSLTDPERVRSVLTQAGFADIALAPVEVPMTYGPNAASAAEMFVSTGPARFRLRDADPETKARALQTVTAALRPYEGPDGVRMRGAFWCVSALRP